MANLKNNEESLVLRRYLKDVIAWHGFIRFLGLPTLQNNPDVSLDELYVSQSVSEHHLSTDESPKQEDLHDPVNYLIEHKRVVVLGDPGSGKSTLINWISWYLASRFSRKLPEPIGSLIPITIVLRDIDLHEVEDLTSLITAFLDRPVADAFNNDKDLLLKLISENKVLLLVDGLDEINDKYKKNVKNIISEYATKYPKNYVMCTSRVIGYEIEDELEHDPSEEGVEAIEKTTLKKSRKLKTCYTAPFTEPQISIFALKWYRDNLSGNEKNASLLRDDFVEAIGQNPSTRQLARTPHLLTMMALIYKIKSQLPNGRALLYDLIAQAYLESIDTARKLQDKYLWQEKKRWLARVGFEMQIKRSKLKEEDQQNLLIDKKEVLCWIELAMKDSGNIDVVNDGEYAKEFLDWIARRSGLLIPRGENKFAFLHLSFQEYFSAVYIQQQIENPEWDRIDLEDEDESTLDERFKKNILPEWAVQEVWQQPIILLFELMGTKPSWPRQLWRKLFSRDYIKEEKQKLKNIILKRKSFPLWGHSFDADILLRIQILSNPHCGITGNLYFNELSKLINLHIYLQNMSFDVVEGRLLIIATDSIPYLSTLLKLIKSETEWKRLKEEIEEIEKLVLYKVEQQTFDNLTKFLISEDKLSRLCLSECAIHDIGGLRKFKKLKTFEVDQMNLDSLEAISGFEDIEELFLYLTNTIPSDEFHKLKRLKKIKHLSFGFEHNPKKSNSEDLIDLSFLAHMKSILNLSLPNIKLKGFKVLEYLPKLECLFLSGATGFSFDNKLTLPKLNTLILRGYHSSLEGISKMESLTELTILHSEIKDLKPLINLDNLKDLRLYAVDTMDLKPIVKLKSLRRLSINGTSNHVDITPLRSLSENIETDFDLWIQRALKE